MNTIRKMGFPPGTGALPALPARALGRGRLPGVPSRSGRGCRPGPFFSASVIDGAGMSGTPSAAFSPSPSMRWSPLKTRVDQGFPVQQVLLRPKGGRIPGCWSGEAEPLHPELRLFVLPSLSATSCLIWSLGSFGKLAIRAILWGYVYVSLVSLQINSKGRGQAGVFHSTAAPPRRLVLGFGWPQLLPPPSSSRNCLLISLPHSHHYKHYCHPSLR